MSQHATLTDLHLWNYLENADRILTRQLKGMTMDSVYQSKYIKLMSMFGKRLTRLFTIGKNKFHPNLLKRLQRSNLCGIYLFSKKDKVRIVERLHTIGWSRNAKFFFTKEFPRKNYFDLMCMYDVIIFNGGVLPVELDVYFLDELERREARKRGLVQTEHSVFILDRYIQTYITDINVFNQEAYDRKIIGIGGSLVGLPDWYKALESYATHRLFDANDQPILLNVSNYYAQIGCFIPECVGVGLKTTRYWHAHSDPDFPQFSEQNFRYGGSRILVDFGMGYRVRFILENGKERRALIPVELYKRAFEPVDTEFSPTPKESVPESYIFLYQTLSSRRSNLEGSPIVKSELIARENLMTLEYRQNVIKVLRESMNVGEMPNLVIISPKGSLKTTFTEHLIELKANVLFIDSDEFGKDLISEYVRMEGFKEQNEVKENYITRWFRLQFPELDMPISDFPSSEFYRLNQLDVQVDKFSAFWRGVYDKGLGSVPSFNNYIAEKVRSQSTTAMAITFTHNVFEARMCQSKMMLSIDSGLDERKGMEYRAIANDKSVASFVADELYQRYSLSSKDLNINTVGWGDLFLVLSYLGVVPATS